MGKIRWALNIMNIRSCLGKTYISLLYIIPVLLLYSLLLSVRLETFWFNPSEVVVAESHYGEPIVIYYTRDIKVNEFLGAFSVQIKKEGEEGLDYFCSYHTRIFPYRMKSNLPNPITMDWWVEGDEDCSDFTPGKYHMDTCWTGYDLLWGLVPPKTVCRASEFRVWSRRPKDEF